jgi:hypothetical protein
MKRKLDFKSSSGAIACKIVDLRRGEIEMAIYT